MDQKHSYYMQKALTLAKKGEGFVSPNPMVGALIVKEEKVIALGWHAAFGDDHAEIVALRQAAHQACGGTLYVTLEPCAHTGKTGPCADAIIASGIRQVVIAVADPNPLVCGKGIEALNKAGIQVTVGCCESRARELNKIFFHYHEQKRPYVIAKWAMSLDGKTITHPEDNIHISDEKAKIHSHFTRRRVDAIVIGAHTARRDDPALTVRLPRIKSRQPKRVIITRSGILPSHLQLLSGHQSIIIATSEEGRSQIQKSCYGAVLDIITVPFTKNKMDLSALLATLAQREITSLLLEGGEITRNLFFDAGLIDEIQTYIAPIIIGQFSKKKAVNILKEKKLGRDYFFMAKT